MDMLSGNVRRIYFKYLTAAFGSALISSIYGIVDMAMVGQYQGPGGTAGFIWFAMSITELLVALAVIILMIRYTSK